MRTSLRIVLVAGAGMAAATLVSGAPTQARAAGSEPIPGFGDMSQLMKDPAYREQKRVEISSISPNPVRSWPMRLA